MAEHATLASLTRRLNVRLSLVIGGVSLLVTVLFAGYLAVKENRAQEALAGTTFDYLTKSLEKPVWDLDTDSIREIGSAFCQDNRISRLVVSGNRGEQLFSFARDGTDAAITRNGEIRHNGEVIGAAYLSFSNVSARESQKNLVYFVIWINVIIVLALGLGTGAIVRRQLRVPLEWLKRVVDEYANRAVSLTRVEPPFIEFGPFRDVLFEMAGRSRSQLDDLQGLNQALGESETRFRTLLEHAPIAISVSRDATGLYCNRKFLDMFGLRSVEEAVGRPIVEYFAPQYREASLERSRRRANGLPLPLEFESVALRSDGVQFPIHAAVAEVQLSDGPANIAFITDITGRKRLEDQLRQSQKMQAIGQLAGGVAHDFNNILAATMMTLDLAAENPNLDREAREALKELDDQAKRAASLTRQLLMFSRRSVLEIRALDLNEVIANLLKMLGRILGEHVTLVFERKATLPAVEADAGMLEQVLLNLTVNARDAMPDGGRITLTTEVVEIDPESARVHPDRRAGQFVCLSVSDTGRGMDATTLGRVFEPFFTTKDEGKGTGLGLATVDGIVAQHTGWVEVTSAVARGTTFAVYLPATGKPIQGTQTETSRVVPKGRETILLVEDDEGVRAILNQTLRGLGYQVVVAANGHEAMRQWQDHGAAVDLLLTDMVMPEGMTGLELAERVRAEKPDLKIIISSGYSAEMVRSGKPTAEGIVYLAKPCSGAVLGETVRRCLDGK